MPRFLCVNYKVYYTDEVASNIANENQNLKTEIINNFGINSYINNVYNKQFIKDIIIKDSNKLNILTTIFTKYMDESFNNFCKTNLNESIIFYENALIFEQNKQKLFDRIICVYCEQNIVIDRVLKRNKDYTKEYILFILDNQISPELKVKQSDFVINTSTYFNINDLLLYINSIK